MAYKKRIHQAKIKLEPEFFMVIYNALKREKLSLREMKKLYNNDDGVDDIYIDLHIDRVNYVIKKFEEIINKLDNRQKHEMMLLFEIP